MLQQVLLWILHLILALKRFFSSLLPHPPPQPLRATRRKVPTHLAVTLSELRDPKKHPGDLRDALESVRRLADWCRAVGIQTLSLFDQEGVLLESWKEVQEVIEETQSVIPSVFGRNSTKKVDEISPLHITKAFRILPTPPLSKSGSSTALAGHSDQSTTLPETRPIPALVTLEPMDHRFRDTPRKRSSSVYSQEVPSSPRPLTVHILSKNLGKAQIADVTREYASSAANMTRKAKPGSTKPADCFSISIATLGSRLEDKNSVNGWPCPDLLIIHTPSTSRKAQHSPLEFEGFPPWQMHLTEITYIPPCRPQTDFLRWLWPTAKQNPRSISENEFRVALDGYNGAEMRFGK